MKILSPKKFLPVLLALLLGLSPHAFAEPERPVKVVVSFSILGDMVHQIGGEAIELKVLAGPNADMHTFQASPQDAKAIAEADIIVINGLGLDRWMQPLVRASDTHAKLLVASAGVKPRKFSEGDSTVVDPHAWQDLSNGRLYLRNIANALVSAAPAHGREIRARALSYDAEMKKTDSWVREQFARIPLERRKIITSHDAFGYFGDAYGVTFLAPQGLSTEAETSAFDIAKLVEQIKGEKVGEVFIENMTDPRLMEQIARDSGAKMGGILYSDSLSTPNGPAPTYLDMFRNNAPLMREAMMENGG